MDGAAVTEQTQQRRPATALWWRLLSTGGLCVGTWALLYWVGLPDLAIGFVCGLGAGQYWRDYRDDDGG
jgi:hypothetical protein